MTVAGATASAQWPSKLPGEDLTVKTAPLCQDDHGDQRYTQTWNGFEEDPRPLFDDPGGVVDEKEDGVYNNDDEELAAMLGERNHIGHDVGLPDGIQPLFPDFPLTISNDDNGYKDDSNDYCYRRYRHKGAMERPKKNGSSKLFAKDVAKLSSKCENATEMKGTPSQVNF